MDLITSQRKLCASSQNTALWYIFIIQTVLGPEQRGSFAYSTIFLCSPLLQSKLRFVKCRTRRVTTGRHGNVPKTENTAWLLGCYAGLHQTCAGLRGLSMKRSLTQPPTHTHTESVYACARARLLARVCCQPLPRFASGKEDTVDQSERAKQMTGCRTPFPHYYASYGEDTPPNVHVRTAPIPHPSAAPSGGSNMSNISDGDVLKIQRTLSALLIAQGAVRNIQ